MISAKEGVVLEILTWQEVHLILPLLIEIKNKAVFVYSVLEQKQQGTVYVNNKHNITSALITSCGGFYCLLGTASNPRFNDDVIRFLINKKNHIIDFYALALFSEDWIDLLDNYELPNAKKIKRTYFSFNKMKFTERYQGDTLTLGKHFKLVELNPSIATKYIKDFYSYYSIVWDSVPHFIANGIAHFITRDSEIVSVCSSPYVGGGYAEIDIITLEEHKMQGLATAVGVRFIQECINKGLVPNWCCHADNIESLHMANKLCFDKIEEQPMYWYNA